MSVTCWRSCCGVFLFQPKTAYEMRISDWRSDVCSSDLQGLRCLRLGDQDRRPADGDPGAHHQGLDDRRPRGQERHAPDEETDPGRPEAVPDRKRVVQGKSVSVRVDLGGRRIIKKKNNHTHGGIAPQTQSSELKTN